MIIKKPYAFLIKYFKIIHLVLVVPMVYLLYVFKDISSFLKAYDNNLTTTTANAAGNYITLFTYLAILALLIVNIVIMSLMKSKRKSTKYYVICTLYYIYLLASTIVFYATFNAIDKGTPDTTLIGFVSSLSVITLIPSYILIVAQLVQASGFNVKTFRFDKTMDLQITDEDEEEVELKFLKNDGVAKRNIVHSLRELKYYALENKGIFTLIGIILGIVIIVALYMEFEVYNKRYNLYQAFALDSFTMTMKESYLTNVDYSGKEIEEGKYFLAIKIAIYNKTLDPASVSKENFRIYFDDEIIYPSYDRSSRFIDIGKNYQGGVIQPQTGNDYVLVYELTEKQLKNKYKMKILSSLKQKPGKLIPSYKIINIKPTNIISSEKLKDGKIGQKINLSKTFLGDTNYTLRSITYTTNYLYEYKQCSEYMDCIDKKSSVQAQPGKILLVIKDSIDWDQNTSYYKLDKRDMYKDFVTLEYEFTTSNNKKLNYSVRLENVTPTTLNTAKIYEVGNLVARSHDVKLKFKIRNTSFYINLDKISELK